MNDFFTMEMQTAGMQVLESSYIIATSKNIETIKSRHDFLLQRIASLKQGQSNSQYSSCVHNMMEQYKTMYFDRPLQDCQIAIISNPNSFDLNNFYCNSLLNAMRKFCGEQQEEINGMKKETAKIKRETKVLETIRTAKNELQINFLTASSYSIVMAELENLESKINKTPRNNMTITLKRFLKTAKPITLIVRLFPMHLTNNF